MTETQQLAGSLSNDLFRVAALFHRGSVVAAERFLREAKRWTEPLGKKPVKPYIRRITQQILECEPSNLTQAKVEDLLMYGVLLQNFTLHHRHDI